MESPKSKGVPICHWCKEDLPVNPRSDYRTPLEGEPGVGWVVCGPICTQRPPESICYDKDMLDRALLR